MKDRHYDVGHHFPRLWAARHDETVIVLPNGSVQDRASRRESLRSLLRVMRAGQAGARPGVGQPGHRVHPRCIVCGDTGCEHCPDTDTHEVIYLRAE
jgi:hypothetical protein